MITQLVKKSACNAGDPGLISWIGKICWRRDRLPISVFLGFPYGSAGKESACNAGDPGSIPGLGRFPWRRDRLPISVFLDFPCGSDSKESTCNPGDLGLIPGLGRSPGGWHGNPLQYSCLGNLIDRGTWWATVHGVTKTQILLSD